MSRRDLFLKILLPILILVLGAAGMVLMIKGRQAPAHQATPFAGVLVETLTVHKVDHTLSIRATGTVQPSRETDIVPQVNGRIVQLDPAMVAGGFFRTGEEMFRIERIDYELALEQARSSLVKAELELETMRARAAIAQEEWQRLHPDQEPNPLVAYKPQLKNAEAAFAAARARLSQAELDLQRTEVTAPFNGFVRDEQIDLGQYIKSGNKVATLTGTDQVEIIVPLQLDDLRWLDIPHQPGKKGSPATVQMKVNGREWQWQGWLARSLGDVDPRGRMARVAIIIPDPYALDKTEKDRPPLAVGSFVEVVLKGETLPQVIEVPRNALRENDTVWVMDEQSRLRILPVEIVRREKDLVLVAAGLQGDEEIIVSAVSGAADGLQLRREEP